ncbi:MAG: hypothetical protein U0U69_00790 [Acidimicrobiia bacterium]
MRTWCVVLVATALLSIGLVHAGVAQAAQGHHEHGPTRDETVPAHCINCTAPCLGGLVTALGALALARRRGDTTVRWRARGLGELIWAWTFEHPPRVA